MAAIKIIDGSPFALHDRLTYVSDEEPGITRQKVGRGFSYRYPDGERVTDSEVRNRIQFLAIPPAYEDVWISPQPEGHLQATGRDERGRKQYRYHPLWQEERQRRKFESLVDFALRLPRIRRRVSLDLQRDGLGRRRALAAVVRLLEVTRIRIGNDAYARENRSFGLTTLRPEHVDIAGNVIHFDFRGKGGIEVNAEARHPSIARILSEMEDLPGQYLFGYRTENGQARRINSTDVNEYLRRAGRSEDISAKDFRTWNGTVICAQALAETSPASSPSKCQRQIMSAVRVAAKALRNRPTTCRDYYVHPEILEGWERGRLREIFSIKAPDISATSKIAERYHLKDDERRVLKLLKEGQQARKKQSARVYEGRTIAASASAA